MIRPEPALDVDLDAGFRVVARYQLAGRWQVPAELVRMAVAHGAREVEARIRARSLVVVANGAVVPTAAIEGLATILNGRADDLRLRALTMLEDLDAMALGWAIGSSPRRLEIEQRSPTGGISFVRDGEEPARLLRLRPTPESVLRVSLERPSFDAKQAAAWLETAARFAAVPIRLEGKDLRQDLRSGCFRAQLEQPLPVTVALGVSLESPRLWLLRHGILEARVSVPGWPAFEGAVELADVVEGWVSPADLRRALSAHLPELISRVVGLTLRVVPQLPDVRPRCRSALVDALITAAEKGVRLEEVRRAPIFALDDDGRRRWLSLNDLASWPGRPPVVAEPDLRLKAPRDPVLRLGQGERVRVGAMLNLIFRRLESPERTVFGRLRDLAGSAVRSFRPLRGSRPMSDDLLDPAELSLIRGLAGCFSSASGEVSVAVVSGAGPVRQFRLALDLPRDNPLVQACSAVVLRNDIWLYAAARALGSPRWDIDDGVRRRWIDGGALGESPPL